MEVPTQRLGRNGRECETGMYYYYYTVSRLLLGAASSRMFFGLHGYIAENEARRVRRDNAAGEHSGTSSVEESP